MRKLKLDPESLEVESFAVLAGGRARGTVRAASESYTHKDEYTCGISCIAPCQHTREVPGCGVDTNFGCV